LLTIAPLKRWSVRYYNDTSRAAVAASLDRVKAGGGLGEYYSEGETRAPVWMLAGDTEHAGALCGLSDTDRAGGPADLEVVARWLDDGVAPGGACGRAFSGRSNRGFDLTFCAPKSVSLLRALDTGGVASKAVVEAHNRAVAEALAYLHTHAGYTRVHNPVTGKKDLQRLPGLVAAAYQHETSRAGDPHLHTHVLVPNKQARGDGMLVAVDSDALWHEAKAAGIIYQTTLRQELNAAVGVEWARVDAHSGMAELAGVDRDLLAASSQRSTQLAAWAAEHLLVDNTGELSAGQLAAAQKATRPRKPEHRPWAELKTEWAARFGGELVLDAHAQDTARTERRTAAAAKAITWVRGAVAGMDKPAFTRADLIEALGAHLPVTMDGAPGGPRRVLEALADAVGMRITDTRQPHEREGHDRYTAAPIITEEAALYTLISIRNEDAVVPDSAADRVTSEAGLSEDQRQAVTAVATSPWLIQPLSAPAGAGKTTSLRALRETAHEGGIARVVVVAPTGKAVDVALAEGAGDVGGTVAKALTDLKEERLSFDERTLLVVDEAGMVGTPALRELLTAATHAGTKTVLVGDPRQLAPVQARGGMFAQLCADLPWAQSLSEVWRMRDAGERAASLAVRDGQGAALTEAIDWYRRADRLRTGDPVTMADDALTAWTADHASGVDSVLIADRWEIADALNARIHRTRVPEDADTLTGARRHRIGVGDVVISRRNDPTITVYRRDNHTLTPLSDAPVRNGQRWKVAKIDVGGDRIGVRRIGDDAVAVFEGGYLHTQVHHGYAVTVHAAQGTTAQRCHAVLATTGNRASAYVAMTRGRDNNTVYLYDRVGGEGDHEHTPQPADGVHAARRGDDQDAAAALRNLLGRDNTPRTVIDTATTTVREQLPDQVQNLLEAREHTLGQVRVIHDKPRLAAEIDWLQAAGGWSPAGAYLSDSTDQIIGDTAPGLSQPARDIARAVVHNGNTVQPLHLSDGTEKSALLAALAACARAAHKPVVAIPGTEHARRAATGYARANNIYDADTVLGRLDTLNPRTVEPRLLGALFVVDDADHLTPNQLQRLAEHAGSRNIKLLLVTTDSSGRHQASEAVQPPGRHLIDTAHAHLPWAQHLGEVPARDTALRRAQHLTQHSSVDDPQITDLLGRATRSLAHYAWRNTPRWAARDHAVERSRDQSHHDYGLEL
jgi:conjugative relaxase-like TrwC/TraI family protein